MGSVMQSALAPFTLKGFYLLTWGTALGTNVWNTLSGIQAFKTLDRESFGHLQSSLQPAYFSTSSALTGSLLATHFYFHPLLLSSPFKGPHWYQIEEGVQAILIVSALVPQLINWIAISPKAVNLIYGRRRLERAEGKAHDASNPSAEMTKVNAEFSRIHRIATALNSLSFLALAGLGLAVSM